MLAMLSLAALGGCVSNVEIPFDHGANADIKHIGILTPHVDDHPQMVLASDIGQSFGLIGALVDVSLQEKRDKTFAAILSTHNDDPKANFVADLKASLAVHGYSATDVPVERPDANLLKTYPKPATGDVDAYLDVTVISYGYVAAGIADSNPYRPFVSAKCRLVRARDGAVLMEDTVLYNPVARLGIPADKAVTISPDPAYAYPDFDSLTGSSDAAVKGLDASLKAAADSIGTLAQ